MGWLMGCQDDGVIVLLMGRGEERRVAAVFGGRCGWLLVWLIEFDVLTYG